MIYVDGDGCPSKDIIIKIAKEYRQNVTIFIDSAHVYNSNYATVVTVDKGLDSVDYAIIKEIKNNDILISSDYALCALALTKQARPILSSGKIVSLSNIDTLLMNRYINKKARDMKLHCKGPKKRTKNDNINFENALRSLLEEK